MAHQPHHGRGGGDGGRPSVGPAGSRSPRPAFPGRYADPGKDYPRPALVDAEARAEAQYWVNKCVKTSQMRRFFGAVMADLRRFELRGKDKVDDQEAELAMVMLKANAHYAKGRSQQLACIAEFFDHHARLVKTQADFRHFVRHFEAIVAYHKLFENENGGRNDD